MAIALYRKIIAGVSLAACLVTGIGAGQAQADEYDTQRVIAALLGLAVIGAIVADSDNDDDHRANRVTRRDPIVTHRNPVVIEPRPLPSWVSKRALPERCLRTLRSDRGNRQVFGARCLQRNYGFADRLPRSCERRVRTDRGVRTFFGARCLRNEGFRVSGR